MRDEPPATAAAWGLQTSAFFADNAAEKSPPSPPTHHRSLSAFVAGSYVKDPLAGRILGSPAGGASPTRDWQNDQEYYEWAASHPTSPLLSPCQDPVPFQVERRFDGQGAGGVVQVDTKQLVAEGQHSLLFSCTNNPTVVCKCAKSDRESMESVGREFKVYTVIMGRREGEAAADSRRLMRPVAVGSLTVRGIARPAVLLPRALGPLSERDLPTVPGVQIARSLFGGLQELHALGIVHGDIKPHNVFNFGDCVQIGDFGAARFADERADEHAGQSAAGTLPYQAPEQVVSDRPTFQSDVYSAGVSMWSILTHKQPFTLYTSSVLMLLAIRNQPFLANHDEPASSPIWQCVKDCVDKDPGKRPTAAEVVQRLAALQGT